MRIAKLLLFSVFALWAISLSAQSNNLREYGIEIGVLDTGTNNSITDVRGVLVGHQTLIKETHIRTGVTAILPHSGNIFQKKVPAAVHVGNGFGKLAGSTQIQELGNIETPIILTNTLSVPTAADALIDYTFSFDENKNVRSVNPVVGETNDGYLNDIRGRHVTKEDVLKAIRSANSGKIAQKGGLIKNKYNPSHRIGIADAVIAATALVQKAKLLTLNVKQFPMVDLKEAPY